MRTKNEMYMSKVRKQFNQKNYKKGLDILHGKSTETEFKNLIYILLETKKCAISAESITGKAQ